MTTCDYYAETPLADGRLVRLYFASSAAPDSLDRLCLYLAALPRMSGHPPGTIPDPLDLVPGGPVEGAHYLVAEVEGAVVGAVALLRNAPAARYGYHMAHVAQMHIDLLPDWRGQGVGRTLVDALITWAKTQPGLKRLELDTFSCNEWVIELLSQAGFVVEGRSRASWYVRTAGANDASDEVYLDRIIMGLLLDEVISIEPIEDAETVESIESVSETAVARDPSIPDVNCSPFFADLVSQVRAFLPYELREFETQEMSNEVHMLIEGLPERITFAVAFRLASAEFDTPDMIEIGLHLRRDPAFNQAQIEHLREKLETLGDALGKKTLHADVWREDWGRVALRLPYQPPDEVGAFMLAAQAAGFIQVLLPEAKAGTG